MREDCILILLQLGTTLAFPTRTSMYLPRDAGACLNLTGLLQNKALLAKLRRLPQMHPGKGRGLQALQTGIDIS
jgi:hypothetical protein